MSKKKKKKKKKKRRGDFWDYFFFWEEGMFCLGILISKRVKDWEKWSVF